MKKRLLASILLTWVITTASAITPDQYWYNIQHYFLNKDQSIITDTMDIYTSGETIPLSMDSMIFMFFNGVKAPEPSRYEDFKKQVKESKNARLMRVIEIIEDYDLEGYIQNPKSGPVFVDNLLLLFYATGDYKYIEIMYGLIQKNYGEEQDKDRYLTGRSAIIAVQRLMAEYPDIETSFLNNRIIDPAIMEYISNTTPDTVRSEGLDYIKTQKEKGVWK